MSELARETRSCVSKYRGRLKEAGPNKLPKLKLYISEPGFVDINANPLLGSFWWVSEGDSYSSCYCKSKWSPIQSLKALIFE